METIINCTLCFLSWRRHRLWGTGRQWAMGETGEDIFRQFFSLSSSFLQVVTIAPESFEYPWDVQTSVFLLLCVVDVFQVMFKIKQSLRNITQRSTPRWDSSEWQGAWDGMVRGLERWTPPSGLKLQLFGGEESGKTSRILGKGLLPSWQSY